MEQLRKAAQDLIFAAETSGGTAGRDEFLCAAIAKVVAALAASQPAEIAEPAPHGPVNPLEYSPCRDYVPAPDADDYWMDQRIEAYAPDLPPLPPYDVFAAAYSTNVARQIQRDTYAAGLAAKRAPMTHGQACVLLEDHGVPPGSAYWDWCVAAIIEASSGLTLAQAREIALSALGEKYWPRDNEVPNSVDHWQDGWNDHHTAASQAIEAAFKEK